MVEPTWWLKSWLGKQILQPINRLLAVYLSWQRAITQSGLGKTWDCRRIAGGDLPWRGALLPWKGELNELAGEERNVWGKGLLLGKDNQSKYTAWSRLRTSLWKSGFGQTRGICSSSCLTYELISRFHFEGTDSIQVWLNLAALFRQSLSKFRMLLEWAFKAFIALMIAMQSQQWQCFDKQIDARNSCCNMIRLADMMRDTCWQFGSTWRVNSVDLHGFNVNKLLVLYEGGKQSKTTVVFVRAFHRMQYT
jgi:hypothetical protein